MVFLNFLSFYKDAPENNQLNFPDVASPIAEQLVFFHDNIMFIIILIIMVVG
jgi:heme/copper-type cytochrome/quinol oxidase subunit 2